MEEIAVKSNAFVKIIPIYFGLGVIAVSVGATFLILKHFEIWVYLIAAVGGFSLLAALTVFLLDRKLPARYIVREGDMLRFENGFMCHLRDVTNVLCKNSVLYVVAGECVMSYRFVSNLEAARDRLLALVEESKKDCPDYDRAG